MKINNISLPYPVLGISDDIEPGLPDDSIKVNISPDPINYIFEIVLNFTNEDISLAVKNGKAVFACEYECSKTFFRKCQKSDQPHFEIVIPRKQVYGRIYLNCYVMVTDPIEGYRNNGFNDDYGNMAFNMEKGDILLAFPTVSYDTDIKYDKLKAAGSFMVVREGKDRKDVFFDLSGNKIAIVMPTKHYKMFCGERGKNNASIIHSSLVLNALTYALLQMTKDKDKYSDKLWKRTIEYRLESEEELAEYKQLDDPQNAPLLAQKLLMDPYLRMLNSMALKDKLFMEE